jgi:hypothetical protein
MLRKDDPVYYKVKLNNLINQALSEGLEVKGKVLSNGIQISFEADNGDIAGVKMTETED